MRSVQVTEVPQDAQLIDVREPDEFSHIHALGAVNLPLSNLAALTDKIDFSQPVYVICKAGGRSAEAQQYLSTLTENPVINVEGGTQAWTEASLPSE